MKRSVNFFRIKFILTAAIIVFPIVFFVTLTATLSCNIGDFWPPITYENSPENTAYVDILVRLPESSEDYVDFAEWEYKEVSITPDSEIARLNADGYVSLSVHYRGCDGFSDHTHLLLSEKMTIGEITRRYGKFKAAYIDENGNVLGITKTARTRYNPKKRRSSFTVNGDKLIFKKWGVTPLQYILLGASILGEPLAVSALVVCNDHYKRQNKQPLSEELQG